MTGFHRLTRLIWRLIATPARWFGRMLIYIHRLFVTLLILSIVGFLLTFTPVFSQAGGFVMRLLPTGQTTVVTPQQAQAIVVLGGGLTQTETQTTITNNNLQNTLDNPEHDQGKIVVNGFTLERLKIALAQYHATKLPIILSGVESPWMQRWLRHKGVTNIRIEGNSMNTCENARFTAQSYPDIDKIILVTGQYHMARARRQFALNNIASYPAPAPIPHAADWRTPMLNFSQASRRTLYEYVALTRDYIYSQDNCRTAPDT